MLFVEEHKLDIVGVGRGKAQAGEAEEGGMELAVYLEHLNVVDAVYERYGVEEEDFSKAVAAYDLLNDAQVRAKFQENLDRISEQAAWSTRDVEFAHSIGAPVPPAVLTSTRGTQATSVASE